MRIGIISDTHGSLFYFKKALNTLGGCDYIIHGGDVLYHGPRNPLPEGYSPKELAEKINGMKNIIIARGNCDADVDQMVLQHPIQSPYVFLQLGGLKILVSHGYTRDKKEYIKMARDYGADLFIYGHTHVKELNQDENLIVLNPGSTALPKDGIHSVAVIDDGNIQLINMENQEVIKELVVK
ncbi:phosphodiesterase, MJ0936 family [Desulforamulus reducens MI-1]|uniref:Phosphoesterase n=1 Tax=Desulforamulus reducens (strain ATCC BAA-1160 / DSM 100696 / MI-1) TaxID=349161 RepID=A4J2H4_DESRM|nr:phosphodiesterase [Desulforamulus reducens]ABO49277.1 phosphodiesterase, MJ0936 family [Desulforamulus reducens MI-1]